MADTLFDNLFELFGGNGVCFDIVVAIISFVAALISFHVEIRHSLLIILTVSLIEVERIVNVKLCLAVLVESVLSPSRVYLGAVVELRLANSPSKVLEVFINILLSIH